MFVDWGESLVVFIFVEREETVEEGEERLSEKDCFYFLEVFMIFIFVEVVCG